MGSNDTTCFNIEDYLKWRADVPFAVDPFNEVDNLVLCELAYSDLRSVMPPKGNLKISEIRELFFADHSRDELRARGNFSSKAPLLMDLMVDGVRFGNLSVKNFIDVVDAGSDMQIAAMTYELDDGTEFVCFRGTDNTLVGWKEDFDLSYLTETEGQRLAVQYLTAASERTDRPLRVGGHSKGGNFAVYAASFCAPEVQDRIINVYSNDGPGFRKEVTEAEGYKRIVQKVISIVPETSIIGQLLTHEYEDIVVRSTDSGFQQHDGFNWCLERNRFIRTELSETGKFIRQTQTDWLSKMDDETRETFVNTVFELLEATEKDTFHEVSTQKMDSAFKIISSLQGIQKDQQRQMLRVVQEFLKSGGETAVELIRGEIERS